MSCRAESLSIAFHWSPPPWQEQLSQSWTWISILTVGVSLSIQPPQPWGWFNCQSPSTLWQWRQWRTLHSVDVHQSSWKPSQVSLPSEFLSLECCLIGAYWIPTNWIFLTAPSDIGWVNDALVNCVWRCSEMLAGSGRSKERDSTCAKDKISKPPGIYSRCYGTLFWICSFINALRSNFCPLKLQVTVSMIG